MMPSPCPCCGESAPDLGNGRCDYCHACCDADRPPENHPSVEERERYFIDDVWDETAKLRHDGHEHWQTYRRLLLEQGYDAEDLLSVTIMLDGEYLDWGVLVTRDGDVLECGMSYRRGYANAQIGIRNITPQWHKVPYATSAKRALAIARSGQLTLPDEFRP